MKLDTKAFRYLSSEDWRVLTAVEIGTKNHNIVPTPLINSLASLRGGTNGAARSISVLAKAGLIAKVKNAKYDGYRLTYGGLDYLALHAHTKSGAVIHLGSQMGTGKESDVYLVTSPEPSERGEDEDRRSVRTSRTESVHGNGKPMQCILKLHRLGRISFRSVGRNRDYTGTRQHASWQYLSRLSAQKEFGAMKALYEAGFPVPRPIAWNRHTIVMSLVPGLPLRQVGIEAFGDVVGESTGAEETAEGSLLGSVKRVSREERDQRIGELYDACMEMALRLAEYGCIHGDFNEFNILIENIPEMDEDENEPTLQAQTVSQLRTETDTTTASDQPIVQTTQSKPLIPHLIDFPQITSLSHPQAGTYFDRDIDCIKCFFHKKYTFTSSEPSPTFEDALARLNEGEKRRSELGDAGTAKRLDVQVAAMGFSKKMARDLEVYFTDMKDVVEGDRMEEGGEGDYDDNADADAEAEAEIGANAQELYGVPNPTEADVDAEELSHCDETNRGQDNERPIVDTAGQGESLELTKENLDIANDWTYPSASGLTSKLAALSMGKGPRESRSKPKAVAGWSI